MSSPKWVLATLLIIATTATAVLVRIVFDLLVGPAPAFLIPFFLPVIVTSLYYGARWGSLAIVLNSAIVAFFFTPPVYSFAILTLEDQVRFGTFVVLCFVLSGLTGNLRYYRKRAEEVARAMANRQEELEREVEARGGAERLLEIRVAERTAEIEAQRRMLDAVLDALPVAVIIADATGKFIRINRACYEVCGDVPKASGVEDFPAWIGYWPNTGRRVEPMEWPLSRAVFGSESCSDEIVVERFGDQVRRTLQISAAPVFGTEGVVIAGVVTGVDVTEQKEVTIALREREQKFRAVFHSQFQFIGLMSPEGVLLDANRTALAAAGVKEDSVLGKPFWETAWWTHDPVQQERLRKAVLSAAAGVPDRFEASHPRADGTIMWVDFSLTPYCHDGNVVLLIPEGRDITERKQAEAAVQASEQRFQSFMTHAPIAAWIVDAESRGVYTSPGFDRLLGLPAGAFVGHTPDDLWDAELAKAYVENNRRVLVGGVAVETDEPFARVDGSEGVAHVVKFPIFEPQGAQLIGGVAIDLTASKRAEAAIRESEAFARTVLDALPAHIAVVDRNGIITAVNRVWEQFAEENPGIDGVVSRTGVGVNYLSVCDNSAAIGCEDARSAAAIIRGVLAGGVASVGMEYPCHTPKDRRWFSMSVTPLTSPEGGAVISHTNITARKLAEVDLRASEERFRLAVEATMMGVWDTPLPFTTLGWDDRMKRIWGLPSDALVDTAAMIRMIHPDDRANAERVHAEAIDPLGSGVLNTEFRICRPDGVRWVSAWGQTVFGDSPAGRKPIRSVGVVLDVSDRIEAERRLAESEEQFRNAFEFAPIGMALVAPDGKWLRVNRSVCDMIGYSEAELLLSDFQKITHPDDLDADLGFVQQLLDGTLATYQMEKRYFHKQGRVVHVLLSVTLVRDTFGSPLHFISQIKDITIQKQAERTSTANLALLRQFIEYSPAAIAMFDREVRYIQASNRWHIDYGLAGQNVIGRSHYELFPNLPDRWKEVHRRVLGGAVEACEEDIFHRADGSTEWLKWECLPWHNADGEVGGIIMFGLLITEQKRAEQALRDSEERFRAAMEGSLDSVFFLTAERDPTGTVADFRFTDLNDQGCKLLTLTREQIVGQRLCEIFPVNRTSGFFDKYVRVVETGEPLEEEFTLAPIDGLIATSLRHQVIRVGDGVTITTQDITVRKQVEAALRLSEEKFRRLVDGVANHAIFMLDNNGHVVSWNPAAVQIKGYTTEEILGQHFSVFYTPASISAGHPQKELAIAVSEGRYFEEGLRVRKDGSHFWADVTISALRDDTGQHVGFVKFTHDISERKRSEELIRASLEEKEVMLKEIHHRVKNNLQIVSALLELQSGHTSDKAVVEMFEESQSRVKSMALIHERLYKSGDFAGVDFGEYVRQLADDLYRTYKVTDDDIELELNIDIPLVSIDIAIPCGLLLNELISNCLKHAFPKATGGCIRVSLLNDGIVTVLSVSDDGAGFKPDVDFRNTTSFGLQLVNTLVEQLNGEVELSNSTGTTITVRFPKSN